MNSVFNAESVLAGQADALWQSGATNTPPPPPQHLPSIPSPYEQGMSGDSHLTDASVSKGPCGDTGSIEGLGTQETPGLTGLWRGWERRQEPKYRALISHLFFSPAELCEFIKATEALASHYVAMPRCGSSLFCQVRKPPATRFKDTYLSLV